MKRQQLEPIARAAGAITREQTIVVSGSQSILGAFPEQAATLALAFVKARLPKNGVS